MYLNKNLIYLSLLFWTQNAYSQKNNCLDDFVNRIQAAGKLHSTGEFKLGYNFFSKFGLRLKSDFMKDVWNMDLKNIKFYLSPVVRNFYSNISLVRKNIINRNYDQSSFFRFYNLPVGRLVFVMDNSGTNLKESIGIITQVNMHGKKNQTEVWLQEFDGRPQHYLIENAKSSNIVFFELPHNFLEYDSSLPKSIKTSGFQNKFFNPVIKNNTDHISPWDSSTEDIPEIATSNVYFQSENFGNGGLANYKVRDQWFEGIGFLSEDKKTIKISNSNGNILTKKVLDSDYISLSEVQEIKISESSFKVISKHSYIFLENKFVRFNAGMLPDGVLARITTPQQEVYYVTNINNVGAFDRVTLKTFSGKSFTLENRSLVGSTVEFLGFYGTK